LHELGYEIDKGRYGCRIIITRRRYR
jgi:hypothetical protein